MKKIPLLFLLLFALNSCSFIARLFVVNNTSEKIPIIIVFDKPTNENELPLMYSDSVIKINNHTQKLLAKKLTCTKIDSVTIKVELQPNSTNFINKDFNRLTSVSSFTVIRNDTPRKYNKDQFLKAAERCGLLSPKLKFVIKN